jgi:cytochrome c peroxidase
VSAGIGGTKGPINAPTVFNAGFNFRQFWDGRASLTF